MISVVPAQLGDVEGLAKVHRDSSIDTYARPEYRLRVEDVAAKDFDSPAKIASRKQELKGAEQNGLGCWVAKDDKEVIGFCYATKNDESGQIRAIYILPNRQHQGVGKALMNSALEFIGSKSRIFVEVAVLNKQAISFYRHFGFLALGEPFDHPYTKTVSIKVLKMVKQS